MAGILGRYGYAREQAYFKTEQEADLQNLRRKRLAERQGIDGEVDEEAASNGEGDRLHSERHFEVGMEILQQQARIHDPNAAARKEYDRRVKGAPAGLSPEELRKYRLAATSVAGMSPAVPRMSRRQHYGHVFPQNSAASQLATRGLSPEAQELAQRTYATGVRSLIYGSLLGAIGATFLVGFTLHTWEIHSKEDAKRVLEGWTAPLADRMRERFSGMAGTMQGYFGGGGLASREGGPAEDSEFARRLSASLMRAGGQAPKPSEERE